jgi:hypothetical protein
MIDWEARMDVYAKLRHRAVTLRGTVPQRPLKRIDWGKHRHSVKVLPIA